MPFDALVQDKPLAGRLLSLGITPVPMDVLEAHKAAQLQRYPGSMWATPWPWLAIMLGGAVGFPGALVALGGWPAFDVFTDCILLIALVTLGAVGSLMVATLITQGITVYGPAEWVEGYFYPRSSVPSEIRDLVLYVKHWAPDLKLVHGELRREEVVLDPYIVVERDGERACLGIWDGAEIIAIAAWSVG